VGVTRGTVAVTASVQRVILFFNLKYSPVLAKERCESSALGSNCTHLQG